MDVFDFGRAENQYLSEPPAGVARRDELWNDFDCDPMGGDASTLERTGQTAEFGQAATEAEVGALVPVPARRLERMGTLRGRRRVDRAFAKLWDRAPVLLTGPPYNLLQAIDRTDHEQQGSGAATPGSGEIVRRLPSRGLIDLPAPV